MAEMHSNMFCFGLNPDKTGLVENKLDSKIKKNAVIFAKRINRNMKTAHFD